MTGLRALGLAIAAALLTTWTVWAQLEGLSVTTPEPERIATIEAFELERHAAILERRSVAPWQYRVLSEYAYEGVSGLVARTHPEHPAYTAYVVTRGAQNLCIFLLLYGLLVGLGLTRYAAVVGMGLFAASMSTATFDSGMELNTYSDVLFYLVAANLVIRGRYRLVPLVVAVAVFNRETIGLAALFPFVHARLTGDTKRRTEALVTTALGLVAFAIGYLSLRQLFGHKAVYLISGYIAPGATLLYYNLIGFQSWMHVVGTLGLLPVLGLLAWRSWPLSLRALCLAIVPAWFVIHFVAAIVAESRLLLVPTALVFIPGTLFGLARPRPPDAT